MKRRGLIALVGFLFVASCSSAEPIDPGDGGDYRFTLTAADFVDGIDNPWLPLRPGSRWVYEGGGETIVVEVLHETRVVMGITATVVRDTVTEQGDLVEDTFDWFAQDIEGNVWYLGEESVEYRNGEPVSTAGSWEAGVDGALPGIIMPANPRTGMAYRQEYYPDEAEDMAEIIRVGDRITVPFGTFEDVLVIREWTPLSPRNDELKYFAALIGLIKESGGAELVEHRSG
ncbi:MAG TPA: hypothetical protein VK960_06090 [Acidimicrobiia bacterium]|nr:hypothetical protein [Acidimicrobiia bacterium]